jgi:transposase InsO family protein
VVSWEISNSLESDFCISALNRALIKAKPEIFNSDQGVQFTSQAFTSVLKEHQISISMDGRGRALDYVFVERLWRSVKYERGLSERLREHRASGESPEKVLSVLQSRAAASVARV